MRYKLNKGFIKQKIGNKITIFDEKKSILYTFNKTASLIIEKITLGWEEEKIIQNVIDTYEIDINKAKVDVEKISLELKRKLIIKNEQKS